MLFVLVPATLLPIYLYSRGMRYKVKNSLAGGWDIISNSWFNATLSLPWNNIAGDSAQFGGSAGTITIVSPITVQDLLFTVDNYSLVGSTLTTFSSTMEINAPTGNTATINSEISGSGRVDISGGGVIILGGINTYTGGTTVFNNSTLSVMTDDNPGAASGFGLTLGNSTTQSILAITGNSFTSAREIKLGGGGIFNLATGSTATLEGVMFSSGSLHLTGAGLLVLMADNTYSGGTTISGGVLKLTQVGGGAGGSQHRYYRW
ncbi:hypothetical protein D8682_08555 [Buttiauxella sp. 3AFRM03]|uniref:autotransporter-associated beta strand repeat-containing protein n=1 Tax=Buttiauxella sp. 3AFRM03 TaxID=2479367 RepID=UPI000EF7DE86|nr:autotransporter-associated beta strand repeat-containing protein [Buttiauxella sp. 3AFRM03]AYN27033.1 hypothetical protein D8682_08555 [Buttiauxella sp. 3AFRM03]